MLYDFSKKKPEYPMLSGDRAAELAARAKLPKPMGTAGAQQGPMPDGGTLAGAMSAGADKFAGSSESQQAFLPSKPQESQAPAGVTAGYRMPVKSQASQQAVDWGQYRQAGLNQIQNNASRNVRGAQRAAYENAARRGLMQGGSPANAGIYQGMLTDIDRESFAASQQAQNALDMQIGQMQQDFGLRQAGMVDTYNQGLQNTALGLARQPYELDILKQNARGLLLGNNATEQLTPYQVGMAQQNLRGLMLGNDYSEQTMDARTGIVNADLYAKNLDNQTRTFALEEARAVAPIEREKARVELQRLEAQALQAQRSNDWALMDQLGKAAAAIAQRGGFKVIGGVLGGAMLTNPVTAPFAGYTFAAGGAADQILGGA